KGTKLLPEILRARGYKTIGLVDEWLRRFLPSFRRGFDHYEVPYGTMKWRKFGQVAAPYTTFRAIQELNRLRPGKPFFMYLQYEAPHHPYVRHGATPDFGNRPIDLYDGEIAYADHYVGILMDFLRFTKLLDRTIVVVFGDHGEEFGEHGGHQHSHNVHAESVHVALLVHVPGMGHAVVNRRVSLVDVFPTILDVLGFQEDGKGTQGLSLVRAVSGYDSDYMRPIYSELMVNCEGPLKFRKAIYLGDYKLMWDLSSREVLLYDVRKDPGEKRPLDNPPLRKDLFRRLKTFVSKGDHR
ncbi:MAG: sulfatase, partial [Deltaproteobacteria bacterium]|nr:sulfatase [Deltaproteobacteria bacterium]